MSLTFILSKSIPSKKVFTEEKLIHRTAKTWPEIGKLVQQGYSPVSKNLFLMMKAVELNKAFQELIPKARKRHNIPENGHSIKDTLQHMRSQPTYEKSGTLIQGLSFHKNYPSPKIDYGNHEFELDLWEQLESIIYGNCVIASRFTTEEPIISIGQKTVGKKHIRYLQIEVNRMGGFENLKNFLTKNSYHIRNLMESSLAPKNNFYISDRDLRIYELKEIQNRPFSEILNTISDEFPQKDPDNIMSEPLIRKAFSRVSRKISNIMPKLNVTPETQD